MSTTSIKRTKKLKVTPLAKVGWDPILLDCESVYLADLTPQRLLAEADRRDDHGRRRPAYLRIGVDSNTYKLPTEGLVEILPGLVGKFDDTEFQDGSYPEVWTHWIDIPVAEVRRVLGANKEKP